MAIKEEHRGRFIARDEHGNEYGINVFVEIIDAGAMSAPNATLDGLKIFRTDSGADVNYLEKGKYEIVQTGVVVSSDAPEAQ